MSENDNLEVVRQIYASFSAGDLEAVLRTLDPNISWELPAIAHVPFSGKRHGIKAVRKFFEELGSTQELLSFTPNDFIAQGDRVVVLGTSEWRVVTNKQKYDGDWVHVFTIHNGVVTAFREYTDTAAAERAFRVQ